MDGVTDNGDGTFTIEWTAMVAGGNSTGVGSTWGFYLNIPGVTITGINPTSFTSANGTTLNAVISGGSIEWGDPTPGSGPIFLNIATEPNDQWFPFTITVQGIPTEWNGGGQEGNNCPGGAGSTPVNYEGEFPCFEPEITSLFQEIHTCPGIPVTLEVTPNHLVETITWWPGQTGTTVTVAPFETTTFDVVASNVGCETTLSITVIVDPLPVLEPFEQEVEGCEGLPVVLSVNPLNVDFLTWNPGGPVGISLVTVPTTSPAYYTATGSNICGDTTVEFTVTLLPPPSVDAGDNVTICNGQSTTLQATGSGYTSVNWQPGGASNNSVNVSPSTTTTYTVFASGECGGDTSAVTVTVVNQLQSSLQLQVCDGETVVYNGVPLSGGSTSSFTFTSANGCDSVVTVTVNELPNTTSTLQLSACDGESVVYNGQTLLPGTSTQFNLTAFNGCDSLLTVTVVELPNYTSTLTLEACEGESATYNGQLLAAGSTTNFTLQAFNGCDSVVTVVVNELPNYATSLTLQTCTGTTISYNGQALAPGSVTDFTLNSIDGCDSVVTVTVNEIAIFTSTLEFDACPGTTVSYNGQSLPPNTVTDFTFSSAGGCDSVVTVTVNEVAAFEEALEYDACTGTTILYNGENLLPGSVTEFSFQTAQGCDSIVTVTVNELQTYTSVLNLQACTGNTVLYNGQNLAPGTTTDFILTSANGCDSVVTVTVEEVAILQSDLQLEACTGSTVFYNGQNLQPGSSTDFTFISSIGCDSIVTVTVLELDNYQSSLALQTCPGTPVVYNGINLSPGTNLSFTFPAANGCDSVVNVTVTAIQVFNTSLAFDACTGTSISYNGQNLLPGSVTSFDFTSSLGCDSTVTVTVNELPLFSSSLTLQACTGSTATYNGSTLLPGSVTDFTLSAQNGCDSVVTVTVDEVSALTSEVELSACTGSTADYYGQALQPGSTQDFMFNSSAGCDSIVTVTVLELLPQASSLQLSACTGTTAWYNGQNLQPGSTQDFTFQTWQGCDSVVTVTVDEWFPQASAVQLSACTGTTASYNGQNLQPGSTQDFTFQTWQGCDSVVTVTVDELSPAFGSVTLQGCDGVPLIYQGTEIAPGSSMDFTYAAANGCDSVVTVTALPSVPVLTSSAFVEICDGGSTQVFGQTVTQAGEYSQSFTSSLGCDSIHTVTVAINNNLLLDFPNDITIGLGETATLNPLIFPPGNQSYTWQPDPTLSCLDCKNPIASPLLTTTYTLTVNDSAGCEATASQVVVVDKTKGVFIPNAFSPNGDGFNDVFMIFSDGRSVRQVHSFLVFSRWGESVFEFYNFPPDDVAFGWNGLFRDKKMDTGVFAYFAEVEFIDGEKKLFKGDVVLMR